MQYQNMFHLLSSILFLVVTAALPLRSVTAQQDAEIQKMEEIVVTGVRGSLLRSLVQKRDAIGIVDAVSAEDVGKFPDINLSESLQRIPGITLNRDNGGRGQRVNLRGLSPGFTRVEINGMTATSNSGSRGFDFGLLPSELFTNAAVYKTGRARDAEGGLAGLIQLSTPRPLDGDGFGVAASAQGDYSENADDLGGRATLLVSNNFSNVFGLSAAVVYTEQQYQANQVGGFNVRPLSAILTPDARASATPTQLAAQVTNIEHYIHDFEDRSTISTNLAAQWRPSDAVEVTVNGLYSELDTTRFFTRADAPSEGNITGFSNLVIEDDLITSATLSGVQQRLGVNDDSADEDFLQITSSIAWAPGDNWTITPFIGYSKRAVERVGNLLSYRRADLDTGDFISADVSYTYRGDFVDFTTTGTDFSSNPEEFLLNVFLLRPTTSDDEDFVTKLDFEKAFDNKALKEIGFGIRYSDRQIAQTGMDTRVIAESGYDRRLLPSLADAVRILRNFDIDGAPSSVPDSILSVDPVLALSQFAPNGLNGKPVSGAVIAPRPLVTAQRSFDVQEKTFNAYAESTFEIGDFIFNAGLRFVRTEQTSSGFTITNRIPSPIRLDNKYEEFLPSLSARHQVYDGIIIRASYSRTLTRPKLGDLAPTEIVSGVDEGGGVGSQGNPDLMPFTADNIDFGVDWYFGDEGFLSANFFYKDIDDIIDTESFTEDRTFPRQRDDVMVTAPIVFTRPANGVSATIKGFELSGQLPFAALSKQSFLRDVGVFANYTYADSAADFSMTGDVRSSGLPGLSKNSFNTVLYYDDGRIDARVAYAWRSDYLQAFSGAFGIPRFEESRGQLDLSVNYTIFKSMVIQFQALNLTESQRIQTTSELRAPNNVRQFDRRFLFGFRYSY